jgi:hypothetical protein
MKPKILILLFAACAMFFGCSNSDSKNESMWIAIYSSNDIAIKKTLDGIFSENNTLVKDVRSDTLLIINTKEEFLQVCNNTAYSQIDFQNQCIVWGKIQTSSISNKILNKRLFACSSSDSYKYEVVIDKCTECWTAIGSLYFWDIFPQKINGKITLIVE